MGQEGLLQIGPILDFVKLLIWTGQLDDERPGSAIIVAPPGAGKTSILASLQCEQAKFEGDFTARTAAPIVHSEKITHILLGDMLSIFGHRASTVKLSMNVISKMTGETLETDPWTGAAIPKKQIGLITAIPTDDFQKYQKHIKPGGFASRFLVIKYNYKASTIAAIHRFIAENKYAISEEKSFVVSNPCRAHIAIPPKISDHIKDFGVQIKKDPLGFRAHRHLRSLVKAHARRSGRAVCTMDDFTLIESYCDFFSTSGKEI